MVDPEEPELRTEAEAQSQATIMPWIWGAIGLLVVAAFVAWVLLSQSPVPMRHPPAATPLAKSISQRG